MGDLLSQLPNGIGNVEASPVSPLFNSLPAYHFIAGWDAATRPKFVTLLSQCPARPTSPR